MPRVVDSPLVLHVVADGRPGGGTTNVLALATDLTATGWPSAVASDSGSTLLALAAAASLPVIEIDWFQRLRLPAALRRFARDVDRLRPEIVHLHGNRAGVLGAFVLGIRPEPSRPRLVYTVRGFHFVDRPQPWRTAGARAQAFTYPRLDAAVWVSEHDRRIAETEGWQLPPLTRVIPNGVDRSEIPHRTARPFGGRLAFLGRLSYPKHPLFMVDLMSRLPSSYSLLVIGGGDMERDVRAAFRGRHLDDRVRFTGERPHTDALSELAECDVLVMPSRWEGFPTAPLEAMAMGVPVVASAVRGNTALIRNGENGLLFPLDDVPACVDALERLREPSVHRALVAAGLATSRRHTRAAVTEAHHALYRELLSSCEK